MYWRGNKQWELTRAALINELNNNSWFFPTRRRLVYCMQHKKSYSDLIKDFINNLVFYWIDKKVAENKSKELIKRAEKQQ